MIDLAEIRDHLAASVPVLREVGLAKELGALRAGAVPWPAAYVVPMSEQASDNRYQTDALTDQRVVFRFAVILAVRDIGTRRGSGAVESLVDIRDPIVNALATFVPTGADTACIPRQGRLVSGISNDGGLFWQDDFNTAFNRRIIAEGAVE